MSASRLPGAAKYSPNLTSGALGNNGSRSANRIRRDAPPQLLGRGQRNSSVGLRSASIVGEVAMAQPAEPQPYGLLCNIVFGNVGADYFSYD